MAWGLWSYRLFAFVPTAKVATFLDFASPLLIEGVNETLMLNNWQYSSNGSQPYSYAAVNLPIHQDTLSQWTTGLAGSLSTVKYYIISAETGLLAYTSSALTVGNSCTWANAVADAMTGLTRIASNAALQSNATLYNHDSISSIITSGGNNAWVIIVSNLNDSGPGSLRDALTQNLARYVKIRVTGIVTLLTSITAQPNLTIVTEGSNIFWTKGAGVYFGHDSIVKNICFTNGVPAYTPGNTDALGVDTNNIHIINCNMIWGADSNVEVIGRNILIDKCLIAESLDDYGNKGVFIGQGGGNVTLIGCVFASIKDRNPTAFSGGRVDVFNCVIYNFGTETIIQPRDEATLMNVINNWYEAGPISAASIGGNINFPFIIGYRNNTTTEPGNPANFIAASGQYLSGNILMPKNGTTAHTPQTDMIQTDSGVTTIAVSPTPFSQLHIDPATLIASNSGLKAAIMTNVGILTRDTQTQRIINYVANNTGYPVGDVDNQDTVGGYPAI